MTDAKVAIKFLFDITAEDRKKLMVRSLYYNIPNNLYFILYMKFFYHIKCNIILGKIYKFTNQFRRMSSKRRETETRNKNL